MMPRQSERRRGRLLLVLLSGWSAAASGQASISVQQQCLLEELEQSRGAVTREALVRRCLDAVELPAKAAPEAVSLLQQRRSREKLSQQPGFLNAHQRNYLLPLSYQDSPNNAPFVAAQPNQDEREALQKTEVKFQLSLKVTLAESLLLEGDRLHLGFTILSYWQAYHQDASSPFRETNYEPEVFWTAPFAWAPWGAKGSLLAFGLSHQSNGRSVPLSRSWNRLYASFALDFGRWVVAIKPWWRIPEQAKRSPDDPSGDDNPDIERFLGHFELGGVYRRYDNEFGALWRNNLRADNRGAIQLDWTFPVSGQLRGYLQLFSGYGESLIDYDDHTRRVGVGILLSDLL